MVRLVSSTGQALGWLRSQVPRGAGTLRTDSRQVQPGDAFIAWPGAASDGRRHVTSALAAGAAACLIEAEGMQAFAFDDRRIAAMPGLKASTGAIADGWFDSPSQSLQVVAITGTNGKTSSAWWTAQALAGVGRRCLVVGTLGIGEPGRFDPASDPATAIEDLIPTGLTTPDPVTLQRALRRAVDDGVSACAIEASSIGLAERRLDALAIDVALLTNFTRDHLDYHGDMDAYWAAKRALFGWPGLLATVINVDDLQGAALAAELDAAGAPNDCWTTSLLLSSARLHGRNLRHDATGLAFEVAEHDQPPAALSTRLSGAFNAANVLGVIGVLRALGVPLGDAAQAASALGPVPGRLQRVPDDGGSGVAVLVDYAHTPDALDQVLQALRPLALARSGRLWCVFGCGGNRDTSKRPLMGAIAARRADRVVVTSDNPRLEHPCAILAQVLAGVTGHDEVDVIEDRAEAIAFAIERAGRADVVLLAGKGHEDYQDIDGVKRPFSDLQQARAALRRRAGVRHDG